MGKLDGANTADGVVVDRGASGPTVTRPNGERKDALIISRRTALLGLGALAASGLHGRAARASENDWLKDAFKRPPAASMAPSPRPAVIPTRRLVAPDFDALDEHRPFIAGLRPFRDGGMRVSLERPVETTDGPRTLLHNYGHGGAGMTLAFGSAEEVVRLMSEHQARRAGGAAPSAVAILGAGVAGLTTAHAVLRRWPRAEVTIYADVCDPMRTTSAKAGGMFAPMGTLTEYTSANQQALLQRAHESAASVLARITREGQGERFGLSRRPSYWLGGNGGVLLKFGERGPVRAARESEAWLINPTLLLPTLVKELSAKGVRFVTRRFESERDVYALAEPLIVNSTGLGAKALFNDRALEGRRGHLVLLRNTRSLRYLMNGWCHHGTSYLFARNGDIVVGGSIQHDVDVDEFDPQSERDQRIVNRILRSARSLFESGSVRCG